MICVILITYGFCPQPAGIRSSSALFQQPMGSSLNQQALGYHVSFQRPIDSTLSQQSLVNRHCRLSLNWATFEPSLLVGTNGNYFVRSLQIKFRDVGFSKYYLLVTPLVGIKSSPKSQNFSFGSHFMGLFCIIFFVKDQIFVFLNF